MEAPHHGALRVKNAVVAALDALDGLSHRLYVSRRGSISIERLFALESYCRQTSKIHAIVVCLVLSLPAFLVSIVLELIPLQNPNEGWRANYGCWIRIFFICLFVTFGAIMQIDALVPDLKLTFWAMIRACVATSCIFIAIHIGVAASWVFPVPFAIAFGAFPWSLTTVACLVLTVGFRRLRSQPGLHHRFMQQIYMIGVQAALVLVYSIFSAAYYWLPADYEVLFIFLLPLIKIFMQHVVAWAMKDLEEYQPGIVVFCVGVFNALYTSKCMQSSGSQLTYMVIIGFETMQGYLAFRRLGRTMDRFRILAQRCDRQNSLDGDLLQAVVRISQEPGVLSQRRGRSLIRIQSPLRLHLLLHDNTVAFDRLVSEKRRQTGAPAVSNVLVHLSQRDTKIAPITVHGPNKADHAAISKAKSVNPTSQRTSYRSTVKVQPQPNRKRSSSTNVGSKHDIVSLSLKLLFECEFRVLVEYVETVVPVIYAIYIAIMSQLASAQYYPETRSKNPAQIMGMVLNISIYACMEALSFLMMQRWVKRTSTLSPVYILAFVIENQTQELSGRLFVWYIVLLQFTLTHFGMAACFHFGRSLGFYIALPVLCCVGVDFSLRFAWMKHEE